MNGQNFQIRYHATRGLRFAWFGLLITVLPMMLSGNNEGEVILLHEKELMAIVERENHFFERLQASGVTPLAETEAQQIIASYRSYLLRNPDSLDGLILYGKFFRKIGDNQEAIRVFLAARKREPKLAVVHQELGNCLAEEGEYKGALTCFLNAVELDPNQAVYHYQLAVLLTVFKEEFAEMEEFTGPMLEEQADAAFAKAHELAPYNPDVLRYTTADCRYATRTGFSRISPVRAGSRTTAENHFRIAATKPQRARSTPPQRKSPALTARRGTGYTLG
jgi:tetratricopeptide (TPR) repeat protein